MECTYTGQFDDPHKVIKKRRLTGKAKTNAVSAIVNCGKSCETYREFEALRLMKSGAYFSILLYSLILFLNFPLIVIFSIL